MKKYLSFAKKIVALSLLSVPFFSCGVNAGLGPEVDVTAPIVKITSHEDNDAVASTFTLEGTASDNEKITNLKVDFESADLHFQIVPGGAWYKKVAGSSDWVAVPATEGRCVGNGTSWEWSIFVNTAEGNNTSNTGSGVPYSLTAVVEDAIGNSGKNSKVDVSLIMDENNPDVSIYKPELLPDTYATAQSAAADYELKNGNFIAKLLNGDITLSGRQDKAVSFRELRIEFDDGGLSAGTRKVTNQAYLTTEEIAENVAFDGESNVRTYYSKTLKKGVDANDLRTWEVTVPQSDWVTESKNSDLLVLGEEKGSGKLIRVVTTSLSDTLAWERKVIGWFVWWPEADKPWITTYAGDEEDNGENTYAMYPSSNFSGTAQDDDGIASLVYSIETKDGNNWKETVGETSAVSNLGSGDEVIKYTAYAIKIPSENGMYRITLKVTDLAGNTDSVTRYFKTLDVSPPTITAVSNSAVLDDANGKITFSGTVTDDGKVRSFKVIYLHPIANDDPTNIIRYMSGNEAAWQNAPASSSGTEIGDGGDYSTNFVYNSDGETHYYKNKIFNIDWLNAEPEYDNNKKLNTYKFSKTFDIFSDLGIDGTSKPLVSQYFVFRAEDEGGSYSVMQLSLSGDSEAPALTVDSITHYTENGSVRTEECKFMDSNGDTIVPDLLPVRDTDYAILKGTWSDNSVRAWNNNTAHLSTNNIKIEWGDAVFTITSANLNADGTWSWQAKGTSLPKTGSGNPITVSLTDLGGNKKSVSKSIVIESAELGIDSIGAINPDGYYKNGTIQITLNFTKNTRVDTTEGVPTLTLNNGATARYVSGGEAGSASSQHIFEYTISSSITSTDKDTKGLNANGTLDVSKFNANNAVYYDASVTGGSGEFTVDSLPTANDKKLGTSRNIVIDRTPPSIVSLTPIAGTGYNKAGKQILLKLEFDDNVTITNLNNLKPLFKDISNPDISNLASSSSVIFTYKVASGENTSQLTLSQAELSHSGVSITDLAGNAMSSWNVNTTFSDTIVVDTTDPSTPTINAAWGSVRLVTDATSFTITNTEIGATVEYSIDGGSSYMKGTSKTLSNNGTYTVWAKQTDKAGNESEVAMKESITVEKGDFLQRITADTVNGSYSKVKGGSVKGRLVFRTKVGIKGSPSVTLNVKTAKDSNTYVTCPLTQDGNDWVFTYTIGEHDYLGAGATPLDVTGWSFDTVQYEISEGNTVDYALPFSTAVTDEKRFTTSRTIYILTGNPTVESVSLTGKGSNAVLKVTFDRNITKVGGNITFTLNQANFRAPAVLTESEYNELYNSNADFATWYKAGMNGASVSGSTLANDTATKYILDYEKEITNETLIGLFISAKKNVVSIPIVSSDVSASGKVLTVKLTNNPLPVMGVAYSLEIPANSVTDSVQNKNIAYIGSVTADGVEPPTIRIKKNSQTFTISADDTPNSYATQPATASVKMECRTPDAAIKYGIDARYSTQVTVDHSPLSYASAIATAKAATNPSVPSASNLYSSTSPITIGADSELGQTILGIKAAISAQAFLKSTSSDLSYEYATRTVLKLRIDSGDATDTEPGAATSIYENGTQRKFKDLKVWVVGGDSPYGGNSLSPFPLSWSDNKYFKLMTGSWTTTENELLGNWYWASWDITTATYHGFALGDVPSDVADKGPTYWYMGECAWVAQKSNYILYPGETLEMAITGSKDNYQAKFLFRLKNEGKR